jgi:alpha-tubulin suppressor-like RCC1 family protein
VQELSEIPDKVMKISSGGYVTAALTAGNNIYIWGRQGHPELSEPLTGSPIPLDLEGLDFQDVAVGLDHVMLLTTERRILIVGAGGNGQLGLGTEVKKVKDWKEVKIPLKHGQQAVKLHTGYKNSFVIVDNTS